MRHDPDPHRLAAAVLVAIVVAIILGGLWPWLIR